MQLGPSWAHQCFSGPQCATSNYTLDGPMNTNMGLNTTALFFLKTISKSSRRTARPTRLRTVLAQTKSTLSANQEVCSISDAYPIAQKSPRTACGKFDICCSPFDH